MTLAVIVQARMGSTRLPGKVLLPLAGRALLERLLERVRAARTPFETLVATTTLPADDPLEDLCRRLSVPCFRGHPTDLLDRHREAARACGADVVVRIPSDCPLVDPAVIDAVLARFLDSPERFDYVSNLHPATWPDGQDVEVMTRAALETAWREARAPHEREHVTPYLWDTPGRFRVDNVAWPAGRDASMQHRWTVDYPDDYRLVHAVYDALWSPTRPVFSVDDVLALLAARPALAALNARFAGVNWYRHHLGTLRTITAAQTRPSPRGR